MADADKAAVSHTENVSGKPRRRGCLGHCAKFWWAHLIVVIIIVVVVVPVVLLVGVPKIAQSKLDDAELILDRITVTNAQTNNLTMSIDSTIKTDGSVHADIAGFEGVMYLEDHLPHTPFAKINFPPTTADAFQTVNVTQFLPIDDVNALTRFNTWLLANETLRVTVLGDTTVRVKGIARDYGVTFKKTVTMPGLHHLAGIKVEPTWISTEEDDKGNNFRAKVFIPNHSRVAFDLGNVTFDSFLFDKDIGTIFIDNLALEPGMNEYEMRATVDNGPVLGGLAKKPYCEQGGILPIAISGETVVNKGQSLPYFRDALAASRLTVEIPIGQAVKDNIGLTVPCAKE